MLNTNTEARLKEEELIVLEAPGMEFLTLNKDDEEQGFGNGEVRTNAHGSAVELSPGVSPEKEAVCPGSDEKI